MSKGLVALSSARPRAISARVLLAGRAGAERARRHQQLGRDVLGRQQTKAVLLEQPPDPRLQMIVAAPEQPHQLRHQPDRPEVRSHLPKRRPHDRADECHVAASLLGGEPLETPELADPRPMMRIGGDTLRVGPFAERKQNDSAAAPNRSVRQRKRQASTAANDRQRALAVRCVRCPPGHGIALIPQYLNRRFRRRQASSAGACRLRG